jgi:hypothetical protein
VGRKELVEVVLGKMLFFLNFPHGKTEGGGGGDRGDLAGGGSAHRRLRAWEQLGRWGKRRGGRGRLIPFLTLGGTGSDREIDGRQRCELWEGEGGGWRGDEGGEGEGGRLVIGTRELAGVQ